MLCYELGASCCVDIGSAMPAFALSNQQALQVLDQPSSCPLTHLDYENGFPAESAPISTGVCYASDEILFNPATGLESGVSSGIRFRSAQGDECFFFECSQGLLFFLNIQVIAQTSMCIMIFPHGKYVVFVCLFVCLFFFLFNFFFFSFRNLQISVSDIHYTLRKSDSQTGRWNRNCICLVYAPSSWI